MSKDKPTTGLELQIAVLRGANGGITKALAEASSEYKPGLAMASMILLGVVDELEKLR